MRTYEYEKTDNPEYPYRANMGGKVFRTEERAKLFCQMWNDHFAAMKPLAELPGEMSREEYEAACADRGVNALPDSECDSYGVRHGEFAPWLVDDENGQPRIGGYSPTQCVEMVLARCRLNAIEPERKAVPKRVRQPDYPNGRALDCGCTVYWKHEVMSAGLGSSCADCYDRMAE